jgi:hypothetical protein
MFKRWTVRDGIKGENIPETFWFRDDAQDMRDAVEFLYVLDGIRTGNPVDRDLFQLIEVVRA